MQSSLIRTRWAAIGAAVAVSLGAGGIGITQATTSSGEMPIYVPIEPCRLADTRPAFQVGPRTSPLGPAETYTLRAWGAVGQCNLTGKPTGLSLNVTAVGPTLPTFLTLFPANSSLPNASHLNPTPGQPPAPNAVNVDLDGSGEFSIYNLQGAVHIIIDVVGYYDHHTHDDRYYTETEVDAALADKANAADVATKLEVDAAVDDVRVIVESAQGEQTLGVTSPALVPLGGTFYEIVRSVAIDPHAGGTIVAAASLSAAHDEEGDETMRAACGLSTGTSLDAAERLEFVLSDEERLGISPTRTFTVTGRGSITINLLCRTYVVDSFPPPGDPGTMTVRNSALVLTFIPN